MLDIFQIAKPILHLMNHETAHDASLWALRNGLVPAPKLEKNPILEQKIWGLNFANPIGLAAGFDKNAVAINPLLKQGFGFVEVGTVTPLVQEGNDKPRLFRLAEDEAVINRFGFNNLGLAEYTKNFARHDKKLGIAGANIGKNKTSEDAAQDYITCLKEVYKLADYITINISSPNTKGLRDLQQKEQLGELLSQISQARNEEVQKSGRRPILLKIAPDIDDMQAEDIVEAVLEYGIDGIIVSNTTISRPDSLKSAYKNEAGGLSGKPLFALSTERLGKIYQLTGGKIPLIGVGGVASASDAYQKIRAGASLVQLYSALVYQGFSLIRRINEELPKLLARDGFSHISEAVGTQIL